MELFLCVKSVPDSDTIIFDAETGHLRRDGNNAVLNPADLVAAEACLRCAEDYGGSTSAVSMGPPSAEAGLRTALSMGIAAAHLLYDAQFAGADVPATAYTLAAFFRSRPAYDIIFCGKYAADGDTGQTGAMLAEMLDIPHACGVCDLVRVENGGVVVRQKLDSRILTLSMPLPCVVVIENDLIYPRDIKLAAMLRARSLTINREDTATIHGIDPQRCGARGSYTRVKTLFVPEHSRKRHMLSMQELELLQSCFTEARKTHG